MRDRPVYRTADLTRWATLAVAALAAGCAADGANVLPTASDVSLSPLTIDPGQTFQVGYRIAPNAAVNQVVAAELVGLPANSLVAGTGPRLAVPGAPGALQRTDVTLVPPAKDGIYPLTLRLTSRDGRVTETPVGTLTVNDVPARIEHAQIDPSDHRVAACAGQPVTIHLTYTVTDPNGASDLRDPRIVGLRGTGTMAGMVSTPLVHTMAATPPASGYTIVNPTLGTQVATTFMIVPGPVPLLPNDPPAVGSVLTAPAIAPRAVLPIVLPESGVPLAPPTRADVVQETVRTPLVIACSLAAPAQWDWLVQGSDDDAARSRILTTNQATAKYFTSQ